KLAELMNNEWNVNDKNFRLLPSNIGLNDVSIQESIKTYNSLILQRDDLLKSATIDNRVLINILNNITQLGISLKSSLNNYQNALQSNVNALQSQKNKFEGKLNSLPNQERGFKDISREQQIVESLYLFLLQKREETEIQASATPAILKVIDEAYGVNIPVSPKRTI